MCRGKDRFSADHIITKVLAKNWRFFELKRQNARVNCCEMDPTVKPVKYRMRG